MSATGPAEFRPRPIARRAILLLIPWWLVAGPADAAPDAQPWPRWERHRADSEIRVDHGVWDTLLTRYLHVAGDGIHRFDYAAVSADDRAALAGYLRDLAGHPVSELARPEQMAFWINLYNAQTVAVVLDHYPVESIRQIDISPGWFSDGPWGKPLLAVEGVALSLDDIEHRILRPGWRDPRVHYALNCASLGCPNLGSEAYRAADLESQLDAAARAYVNHPRGVAPDGGGWRVSRIYKWFVEDFGGNEAGVVTHLRRYAAPPLARALERRPAIESYAYDWALNDVATDTP